MITLNGETLDKLIKDLELAIKMSSSVDVKALLIPNYRMFIESKIVSTRSIDIPHKDFIMPLMLAKSFKDRYDTEKVLVLKELRTRYDLTLKDARDVLDFIRNYSFKEEE